QPRCGLLEPGDHRIPFGDLGEFGAVMIERQHPRDLITDNTGLDIAVDRVLDGTIRVLADLDPDLGRVAVDAEREPHDTVPVGAGALAEPEGRGLFQREWAFRTDREL